jgi:hypothetical protein
VQVLRAQPGPAERPVRLAPLVLQDQQEMPERQAQQVQ